MVSPSGSTRSAYVADPAQLDHRPGCHLSLGQTPERGGQQPRSHQMSPSRCAIALKGDTIAAAVYADIEDTHRRPRCERCEPPPCSPKPQEATGDRHAAQAALLG